ncbi:site-2 protease family protein [Haloarcula salina]|uniref:Site-2 protease family protein n=1 Tax=Haloarcula salina TaxID=1429914 RepID=A0AA41FZR1_9EURY|nr:site-2 protease family protein [Haloarcula salina]MBV0901757.1 site-2 protease family protein [Haloarcula salina]
MATESAPPELPDPETLADTFRVYEVDMSADDGVRYYGEPVAESEQVLHSVAPTFRRRGYRVALKEETGEHVLVARERSLGVDGVPWTNVAFAVLTLLSTLYAGTRWYGLSVTEDPTALLAAWPFAAAALGILAVHEFGHYVMSRHHQVEASLPYFLPFPNLLGTLGAVIRMNDTIPDRKALFDIGVAGPLAGLAATVVVTAVGVTLPPVELSGGLVTHVELGYPLLLQGVAAAMGEPLTYANPLLSPNPVVIGGWVGAFVTFLNLLPVGQLDGAHVARSLFGDRLSAVQIAVPLAMFGLAGYLVAFEGGRAAGVWAFWGLLALVFGRLGSARPVDETGLGPGRWAVGLLTFVLGMLCFVPVPVVITL